MILLLLKGSSISKTLSYINIDHRMPGTDKTIP